MSISTLGLLILHENIIGTTYRHVIEAQVLYEASLARLKIATNGRILYVIHSPGNKKGKVEASITRTTKRRIGQFHMDLEREPLRGD